MTTDYRARALALVKLGRRKYASEKAWERQIEVFEDWLIQMCDDAGIPRKLREVTYGEQTYDEYDSLKGRVEKAGALFKAQEEEISRLTGELERQKSAFRKAAEAAINDKDVTTLAIIQDLAYDMGWEMRDDYER